MKRNPQYEAGFLRQVADEPTPQDEAVALAAAARRRNYFIGGGALLVVALVAGGIVQLRRDTPAKQLARARVLVSQGDHRAAIVEFKRSLQESPDQPEARFQLGNELAFLGDAKNAEIEYRKAIGKGNGVPPEKILPPLVESLMAQGKFADVVREVNDSTIESPEINAELQTMLGTAYIALDRAEAGVGAFRAAKEMVANFPAASIAEARYMVSQGRYEAAEAMLDSVPTDDRRQAEVLLLKGDLANALKRPQDALAAFQGVIKRDPGNAAARLQLAQIYIDLGQLDLAQVHVDTIVKASPTNARAQYLAALVAFLKHDLPLARDAADRALQLAPGNGMAQLLAGVVAMQSDEPISAEAHLREALAKLPPPAMEARKALIDLYMQRRQLTQADDALQAAIGAQDTVDPQLGPLAIKIALLQGDALKASNLFEQAARRQPTDVAAALVGASLLFNAGKPDAAIARLGAASKANPDNAEIDAALVMGWLQMRRPEAAMAAWQVLDRKKPDSPRNYALRATIDEARGDDVAARQALERSLALDPRYVPALAAIVDLDMKTNQVDQARARLKQVIASDPNAIEPVLLLAHVEEAAAQMSAASELLATARARNPRAIQAISDTIDFQRRQGDAAATLAAAEQGLTVSPNNQDWLLLVGDLSQAAGRKDRALAAYTKLNALNNENADYAVRLGVLQLAMGQSEAALTSFRNAFKDAPQRVDVQVATVEAFINAGRTEDATRMLFEVSKKSPDSPMLAELSADIKLAAKQFPEALAAYRQALATTPSTRLAIKTYKALLLAKQRGQANAVLTDWQRTHPADTAMWLFDAQIGLDAKNFDRAATAYRMALDSRPNDPAILNNLAWTLDQSKDPQALVFAEKAHALAPDNADLADTFGWILVNQGQTQRGVDVIAKAVALAPAKLDIRLRLAKAQIKDGRKDAARATLQGLIDKAPDSVEGTESKSLMTTL